MPHLYNISKPERVQYTSIILEARIYSYFQFSQLRKSDSDVKMSASGLEKVTMDVLHKETLTNGVNGVRI